MGIEEHIRSRRKKRKYIQQYLTKGFRLYSSDYLYIINDSSVRNPFIITKQAALEVSDATRDATTNRDKARKIFDWFMENIDYDNEKLRNAKEGKFKSYRNSKEVLKEGMGLCGEMAYLYTTMARYVGLHSNYAIVKVDAHGSNVSHACSAVFLDSLDDIPDPKKKHILVDPAYKQFDIQHKAYAILPDRLAIADYEQWF
ncbi:MAG: transglutaminase-like domain-containing protein [Candidatus Woesearchaeota archaeon]